MAVFGHAEGGGCLLDGARCLHSAERASALLYEDLDGREAHAAALQLGERMGGMAWAAHSLLSVERTCEAPPRHLAQVRPCPRRSTPRPRHPAPLPAPSRPRPGPRAPPPPAYTDAAAAAL